MQEQKIQTDFGTVWTAINEPKNASDSTPTLICLHGNSVDSRIFDPLLDNPDLKDNYKIIVFDYPGHGRSEDAPDPEKSYFQYAYAELALQVLQHYNVKTAIPIGWSLGGHVALELISVLATAKNTTGIRMAGVVITGTPPVPRLEIKGFRKDADISALFNPEATHDQLKNVASVMTKVTPTPTWIEESVLRTNRLTGGTMGKKFMEGHCTDQIANVQNFKDGWVAVINGGEDALVDNDYCDEVCKGAPRLWKGKVIRIEGQGHAPFYDVPDTYRELLLEFLNDCKA